ESTICGQTAKGRGKQPVVYLIIVATEQHIERISRDQRKDQPVGGEGQCLSQEQRGCLFAGGLVFIEPWTARQIRAVEYSGLRHCAAPRCPFRQLCDMLTAERVCRQRYLEPCIAGSRAVGVVNDALGWATEFSRRQIVTAKNQRGILLCAGKRDTAPQLRN